MFETRLCILLKGLMLAKAIVALFSMDYTAPDRNEVEKVPFANMSIPKSMGKL